LKALQGFGNSLPKKVESMLKHRYSDFKNEDIVVLTEDSPSALWPSKKNVLKYLKWLTDDVQDGDVLFFYYLGHGGKLDTGLKNRYLITVSDNLTSRDVTMDTELQSYFNKLSNTVNVTMFLHCCYSEGLIDNVPIPL
jgi:uncharacterized caspase-like protein